MNQTDRIIKAINNHGIEAKGRKELLSHLEGNRLTTKEMCIAKCYECSGYHSDGKEDCEISTCPLYPVMPYRKKGEKYSSRKGKAMTEEHKAKLKAGMEAKRLNQNQI